MTEQSEQSLDPRLATARRAGQIAKGLALGLLLVIAAVEFYGQIGNLSAFAYQGY